MTEEKDTEQFNLIKQTGQMPCACTIAGSDSGGGAGIQADLKTFHALGVWGCSVITSLTAQNPHNVAGIFSPPDDFCALQLRSVIEDFNITAYKTGMLPTKNIIRAVIANLPKNVPLVADPVMISTSSKRLIDDEAFFAIRDELLPRALIVTPNISETAALLNISPNNLKSRDDITNAGHEILDLGVENVLIKGGHLSGSNSEDYLISKSKVTVFSKPRLPFDVHGSGCCLSSAIAAELAKGKTIENACESAKNFIQNAIVNAYISKSEKYSINP